MKKIISLKEDKVVSKIKMVLSQHPKLKKRALMTLLTINADELTILNQFIQNDLLTQASITLLRSTQVSLENKQENESQSNGEKKRSRENTPIQIEPKRIKVDLPKNDIFVDLTSANLKTIKQNLSRLQKATRVDLILSKITDTGLAHLKQVKVINLERC